MKPIVAFCGVLLLTCAGTFGQDAETASPILLSAKTAQLIVEVVGTRSQKPSFNAEMDRILRLADGTKLWAHYRYMQGPNADIIIKIQEDITLVSSETISLTVFDPDDNRQVYAETRSLVDVSNDVSRLISHFLTAVAQQKRQTILLQEEAKHQAQLRGEITARITCESSQLFENRGSDRRVKRLLHKGDLISILQNAGNEVVIKAGNDTGYLDAECVDQSEETNLTAETLAAWKVNWAKLKKGTPKDVVLELLGEPKSVTGTRLYEIWYYTRGGRVDFDERGIATGWNMPR